MDGNQENVIDKMTNEVFSIETITIERVYSVCTVIHFLIGAVASERPPMPGEKHENSQLALPF